MPEPDLGRPVSTGSGCRAEPFRGAAGDVGAGAADLLLLTPYFFCKARSFSIKDESPPALSAVSTVFVYVVRKELEKEKNKKRRGF